MSTFLDFMDELYKQERAINKIQQYNDEYRHYEKIIPLDFFTENSFNCLKVKKTKILFCPSNVKVYLSDADIIKNIINFDNISIINYFLYQFINLYKGENCDFAYRIRDHKFIGKGISYAKKNVKFLLHTDNSITINEFIFILNMIFEKDRLYSMMIGRDLLKITLCKYITLISLYKFNEKKSRKFLEKSGFPVEKTLDEIFISAKETERINSLFENINLFEKSKIV